MPVAYVGHAPTWDAVEVDGEPGDSDFEARYGQARGGADTARYRSGRGARSPPLTTKEDGPAVPPFGKK